MKYLNILSAMVFALVLISCNGKKGNREFIVIGNIKNSPDQQVYLDRIFFSDVAPEVLDTGQVKNGQFRLTGEDNEEGLYRLRFEQSEKVYFFINDSRHIDFSGDLGSIQLSDQHFSGPSNKMLKSLLDGIDSRQQQLMKTNENLSSIQKEGNDSLLQTESKKFTDQANDFKKFILHAIDSLQHPIVCMFALGFTSGFEPDELKNPIKNLATRFPKHDGVKLLAEQYSKMLEVQEKTAAGPAVGSEAPDFTMNDENGNPFTLSSLRGKYVLVDFWASWCAPCRRENPNVVRAYQAFKDKNFTILGVSLDEDRNDWLNAVSKDKLSWKQVSELKGWKTSVVPLYRFEGIPYNVLLDPDGKILATGLRGSDLEEKLTELLK